MNLDFHSATSKRPMEVFRNRFAQMNCHAQFLEVSVNGKTDAIFDSNYALDDGNDGIADAVYEELNLLEFIDSDDEKGLLQNDEQEVNLYAELNFSNATFCKRTASSAL
jgi:hypothetical protein